MEKVVLSGALLASLIHEAYQMLHPTAGILFGEKRKNIAKVVTDTQEESSIEEASFFITEYLNLHSLHALWGVDDVLDLPVYVRDKLAHRKDILGILSLRKDHELSPSFQDLKAAKSLCTTPNSSGTGSESSCLIFVLGVNDINVSSWVQMPVTIPSLAPDAMQEYLGMNCLHSQSLGCCSSLDDAGSAIFKSSAMMAINSTVQLELIAHQDIHSILMDLDEINLLEDEILALESELANLV